MYGRQVSSLSGVLTAPPQSCKRRSSELAPQSWHTWKRLENKYIWSASLMACDYPNSYANIWSENAYSGAWYPKVPRTLVECNRAAESGDWLDRLKSAILAMKSSKMRTLLDLTSRCTIGGSTFSCKYSSPLAAPRAIFTRWCQLSTGPGSAPSTPFLPKPVKFC